MGCVSLSLSAADEVASLPPLPGEDGRQVLHFPPPHQELEDVRILLGRVDPQPLGDRREVLKQVVVAPIVHQMRGHGDLLLHHLLHYLRVRGLMAFLVRRDGAAYLRQLQVSALLGQPRGVTVGNEGRSLLERGVDEPQVLNCLLDLPHVHPPRKVQVFVQKVAVPVLFGRPRPRPDGPRSEARTGLIPNAVEGVEHRLIRRRASSSSGSSLARSLSSATCSWKPSEEDSGRKSWGCQFFSTDLRYGRMLSSAQPSNDLNISIFWGGMEWVTCTCTS
ncbi:unnamed protein product [Spirodela intermedia]|uniref:Uncharacterized protein n=1 Tax=Spirodela intermedia TaxID=51605 RepID=A0A7I8JEH5_SPIIN|nr:unnamed protein product [Spirodela intermedia]CAA6668527.1 unnamed protein product [Spirodela intermedia]